MYKPCRINDVEIYSVHSYGGTKVVCCLIYTIIILFTSPTGDRRIWMTCVVHPPTPLPAPILPSLWVVVSLLQSPVFPFTHVAILGATFSPALVHGALSLLFCTPLYQLWHFSYLAGAFISAVPNTSVFTSLGLRAIYISPIYIFFLKTLGIRDTFPII